MIYIKKYEDYKNSQEMNEGLKNWLSTFLLLTTLGLVPPSIALSQDKSDKKEFVDNMPQDKLDAALFVKFLNESGSKEGKFFDLGSLYKNFKEQNKSVKSDFSAIEKYVNRSGKQYIFNQKYAQNDYSGVDIMNFQPDNYLTDMANMIDDSQEPDINNFISNYEKQTSVEIGVVTIEKLPENEDIDSYSIKTARRLGVGKKGANNGILIVLSKEDRKWRIEVGNGLEGVITDMTAHTIGEGMVPHLKEGDTYGAIMEALQKLTEDIGSEGIETKKIYLQKEHDREVAAMYNVLQVAFELAILALGITLVVYLVKKRNRKVEEAKALKRKIELLIAQIGELKSKLPKSAGLPSKSVQDAYEECKKCFNSIQTSNNINELNATIGYINSVYDKYQNSYKKASAVRSKVSGLGSMESSVLSDIKSAIEASKEIVRLGYKSGDVPSESEVSQLSSLADSIQQVALTDLDKASRDYDSYSRQMTSISNRSREVSSTLSNIKSTISRVRSWKSEVDSLRSEFESLGGDVSALNSMIASFKSKLSGEDWFALSSELDEIISFMQRPIKADKMRKDQIRREEEERRRRKRREEEEEEESRRRRNSYSSSSSYSSYDSSSSSSSSSSFGGGDFSGGGSSGSW